MDYSRTGGPQKAGNNVPRHKEHNAKGTEKNPFGKNATKAALLERMKAAAAAKKQA
ncbi:hypothetical protein [Parasedimentitalea marina]|uniref:hypothetical protein n=1 Tax=Parasedimentitalea marina TaxID=2483033 RepID=UPI0013E362ED|nr:hypothetical protein [Parasedimentitalea marina]